MKIDVALFEFCAVGEDIGAEFRFEIAQAVYVVRKKNDELQVVACVGKGYDRESFASCVTEIRSFSHHWNIDRCAANEEWLGLRRVLGKLIRPRRFQVKGVRQDESRCFVQRASRNQIANSVASLVCHPLVDALRGRRGIRSEIERLESATEILFHQ